MSPERISLLRTLAAGPSQLPGVPTSRKTRARQDGMVRRVGNGPGTVWHITDLGVFALEMESRREEAARRLAAHLANPDHHTHPDSTGYVTEVTTLVAVGQLHKKTHLTRSDANVRPMSIHGVQDAKKTRKHGPRQKPTHTPQAWIMEATGLSHSCVSGIMAGLVAACTLRNADIIATRYYGNPGLLDEWGF